MLWIMRGLRGNNNNRITSPSDTRPARKEYNQLSSKDSFTSGKSYAARSDSFIESNNGNNDSCSESDSNCTDVEDSNDDLESNRHHAHRVKHTTKKESDPEDPNQNADTLNNNQSNSSKCQRQTRHSSRNVFSDDSDYDEALTCNVCDRTFPNQRQLESHQQKKRHFGCSTCDSLYLSLMALEHHKEEFQHWSDDDEYCSAGYDSDSSEDTMPSEDCERLL